jgi:hypothetical protein
MSPAYPGYLTLMKVGKDLGAFNFSCRDTPSPKGTYGCGCPGRVHPQVPSGEDPPLQPILNTPKRFIFSGV